MNSLEIYNNRLKDTEAAMTQSYYSNQAPTQGNPANIPDAPFNPETGEQLITPEQCVFKWVELTLPSGETHLAILTPYKVAGGHGLKYTAAETKEPFKL